MCRIAADGIVESRMEVAVGAEDGALLEDSNDDSQEVDDDETEDDTPEIGYSDSSDDEDPEILHEVRVRVAGHQRQEKDDQIGEGGRTADCRWRNCCRQAH